MADNQTPWTDEQIVGLSSGSTPHMKLEALSELETAGVLKRDEHGVLFSARMVRDEEIRQARVESGSKGGSKTQAKCQANHEANWQANHQAKSGSSSSSSSDSDSDSGASVVEGNGRTPQRFAAIESAIQFKNRDELIAMTIGKQNPGSGAGVREIKSLDRHDVADWFSRHIATRHPLCGPSALDLLLVLCFARSCSRAPRVVANKVAMFGAGMNSGKWLNTAEGCDEEWEWLVGELNGGRIKYKKQEVAA